MATRYAVANGNWSATATWDGGTLPGAADDVYANNFTVTINQNITVLSIRTTSAAGINAGGGFVLDNAYNITADIRAGGNNNTQRCLLINFNSPNSCTITGTVYGSLINNLTDVDGIRHAGTGTVTVNGSIYGGGGGTGGNRRCGYRNQSTGSVNINGNIYGNQSGLGVNEHSGFRSDAACTCVIVGNVYAGNANNCAGLQTNGGTFTITGKILGDQVTTNGAYGAIFSSITATINGDCESGLAGYGAFFQGSSVFNITGNIIGKASGTNQAAGLYVSGTTTGTVTGNITNSTAGTSTNNQGILCHGSGTINIYGDINRVGIGNVVRTQNSANTINIYGNVYATGGSASHIIALEFPGGILNVTGNVTAPSFGSGNSAGIYTTASATITVNGNVTGGNLNGNQNAGVYSNTAGVVVTINGSAIAGTGSQSQGVYMLGGTAYVRRAVANAYGIGSVGLVATGGVAGNLGAILYVQEFEFGLRGMTPVTGDCRIQLTANSVAIFRDASGNQITLVNPASVVTPPAVTDVRSGVVYNAGNLTGTCAVPAANSVAAGVAVDNTVGTAALTQASVWNYALSSASSVAGSVGEKLKKTAIPADIIALG